MQSCDLSPGAYTIPLSVRVTFPLWSEAVVGVATLGAPVFQTNTIQAFFVFRGTEELPSIRSLFLTEHQSGLLENCFPLVQKIVEYIDVLFHLFLFSFSKPFSPACLLPFKQAGAQEAASSPL